MLKRVAKIDSENCMISGYHARFGWQVAGWVSTRNGDSSSLALRWQAEAPAPHRRINILVGQALSPANVYGAASPVRLSTPVARVVPRIPDPVDCFQALHFFRGTSGATVLRES